MIKVKKELNRHSVSELEGVIAEAQKKLFRLKSEQVVGRLTKTSELWKARKTIAMAKTMLHAKSSLRDVKEVQDAVG